MSRGMGAEHVRNDAAQYVLIEDVWLNDGKLVLAPIFKYTLFKTLRQRQYGFPSFKHFLFQMHTIPVLLA